MTAPLSYLIGALLVGIFIGAIWGNARLDDAKMEIGYLQQHLQMSRGELSAARTEIILLKQRLDASTSE